MSSRLTISNRAENLKVLQEFVRNWTRERGLSDSRRETLEKIAGDIFKRLVSRAYRPGQPGSIAIILEEKGPRVRLMFEDDAPAYDVLEDLSQEAASFPPGHPLPANGVRQLADSLIFYRTTDRKNRLVVFLTL